MKPDEVQAVGAIAQAILALVALVATAALSLLVYRATKRIAALEYSRSLREAWVTLDTVALSSDELLVMADRLIHPDAGDCPIEERRKRWFSYMLLNPLATAIVGSREGVLGAAAAASVERTLRTLVADDLFFSLTQGYAYEPEFVALCQRLRGEVLSSRAASGTCREPTPNQTGGA